MMRGGMASLDVAVSCGEAAPFDEDVTPNAVRPIAPLANGDAAAQAAARRAVGPDDDVVRRVVQPPGVCVLKPSGAWHVS